MLMKASLFLMLSLAFLAMNECPTTTQKPDDQHWIDQLKKTPVNQIETGLSQASFADWFADVVKPKETEYEVKECQDTDPAAAKSQERLLCVFAYTKPEPLRAIQLNFVVGVFTSSKKGTSDAKPVPCRFLEGFEGPSDPRMKRMTRKISKLSELESLLRGSATPSNSL